jgi:hypothetical protein
VKSKNKIYIPPLKGLNNYSNDNNNNNNIPTFRSNRETKRIPNSKSDRSEIDTLRNNNSLLEDVAYKEYYMVNMLKEKNDH